MRAYFTFVLALAMAYAAYYAAMITKDLHGNGGKKKPEEEFDVGEFGAEESVSVVENGKGFSVGENEYETGCTEGPPSERPRNGEKPGRNVVGMLNESVKTNMEEAQATFSNPYNAAELYKRMLEKGIGGLNAKSGITVKPAIDEL